MANWPIWALCIYSPRAYPLDLGVAICLSPSLCLFSRLHFPLPIDKRPVNFLCNLIQMDDNTDRLKEAIMGLFHFGITSLIMVMLFFCVLQLQKTNRHAGIHQPSLRSVRRCLMVMVGLLSATLLSSVGRIW